MIHLDSRSEGFSESSSDEDRGEQPFCPVALLHDIYVYT